MFDGIFVVGARALHDLMKVARRVLLGLCARVIGRDDRRGVGQSAAILSVLFSPLCGGALLLILTLGLALASASIGAWRGRRLLGVLDRGSRSWAIKAGTPVAAACALAQSEPCIHRRSVRSSR